MTFLDLARERYSGRNYSDRPVEAEKIEKILEAGRIAPTACNKQPFKVWVLETEESLTKARETNKFPFFKQANVVLVVGSLPSQAWVRRSDNKNFADVDASIAATQMMLEVQEQGLRTTWVGMFDDGKMKEFFPQMADYELIAMFPIGYPAEGDVPNTMHDDRRSMDEMVTRL